MVVLSINKRRTKKLVEGNLKIFNYYLLSTADDKELIIDRNTFEVKLEIDRESISKREMEKLKFIDYVINRYNRLCTLDRKIIYYTYIIKEKCNDSFIANELGFDLNYYYRIKKGAIVSMAYALNVEVYEGDKDEND
jgi:ArpU family phage transcriptional regulator